MSLAIETPEFIPRAITIETPEFIPGAHVSPAGIYSANIPRSSIFPRFCPFLACTISLPSHCIDIPYSLRLGVHATYDAIVIGAGAAGAIVACVLAEAGKRVLLLERGRQLSYSEVGRDHCAITGGLVAITPALSWRQPRVAGRRTAARGSCARTQPTIRITGVLGGGTRATAAWPGASCRKTSKWATTMAGQRQLFSDWADRLPRPGALLRPGEWRSAWPRRHR